MIRRAFETNCDHGFKLRADLSTSALGERALVSLPTKTAQQRWLSGFWALAAAHYSTGATSLKASACRSLREPKTGLPSRLVRRSLGEGGSSRMQRPAFALWASARQPCSRSLPSGRVEFTRGPRIRADPGARTRGRA